MRLRCNFCNFPPQTFTTYSWESTDHQLPCLEHLRSPSTHMLSKGILDVTPLLDTGGDLRVTGSTYSDGICLHLFQLQQRTVRHALWREVISDQNQKIVVHLLLTGLFCRSLLHGRTTAIQTTAPGRTTTIQTKVPLNGTIGKNVVVLQILLKQLSAIQANLYFS